MDFLSNALNNIIEYITSVSFWMKTLQLIMSLSLLVFVHELGHYFFARLFRIRVDKFYLFFNPKFSILRWDPKNHSFNFFKKNPSEAEEEELRKEADKESDKAKKTSWRDTVYGIGWVPLGGYCSIAGMVDETTTASQLSDEAKSWEFRSKPAWQRLFVMVGGVLFNFLTACVIYAFLTGIYGDSYVPLKNAKYGMRFSQCAKDIGFKDGDIILGADGKEITNSIDSLLDSRKVTVLRNNADTVVVNMPKNFILKVEEDAQAQKKAGVTNPLVFAEYIYPVVINSVNSGGADKAGLKPGDQLLSVNGEATTDYRPFREVLLKNKDTSSMIAFMRDGKQDSLKVQIDGDGKIGISLKPIQEVLPTVVVNYNFIESVGMGFKRGWNQLVSYITMFKYVFTKEGVKSLGSFGAIGSLFGETINWYSFWTITAFLSIILAFMNILPIPILDGGYVLFLLIEMITGWKPSEKFMDICLKIGFAFILLLMVYALGNDVFRFVLQ